MLPATRRKHILPSGFSQNQQPSLIATHLPQSSKELTLLQRHPARFQSFSSRFQESNINGWCTQKSAKIDEIKEWCTQKSAKSPKKIIDAITANDSRLEQIHKIAPSPGNSSATASSVIPMMKPMSTTGYPIGQQDPLLPEKNCWNLCLPQHSNIQKKSISWHSRLLLSMPIQKL